MMVASVAFVGSRSLNWRALPAVLAALAAARAADQQVLVSDCPSGLASMVRDACPGALVFRRKFHGPGALPARACLMIRAARSVVAFPAHTCPAGVVPARSWRAGSPPSGTWSEIALAIGRGIPVLVIGAAVSGPDLPAWPAGSWRGFRRPLGPDPLRCWSWVPAQQPLC